MLEKLDPLLSFIVSYSGSTTAGIATLIIVGALVVTYAVGTIKTPVTGKRKVVFWTSLSIAVLVLLFNALMRDYDERNMKTVITCANTNTYPPMNFDNNVSIYHTSEISVYGYGRTKQDVEIWTDGGQRCDFINGVIREIGDYNGS